MTPIDLCIDRTMRAVNMRQQALILLTVKQRQLQGECYIVTFYDNFVL